MLQHVFVQPLKVILDHDLAADNSGLIDAALFGHCRKSLLPVASRAAGSDAKPIMRSVATGQHFGFGSSLPAAMMKRHAFITLIDGAAAAVCSRTRAAALPTDRAICNARVPHAIGQSFDWLVSAEAELLGARVADRPPAFPLAELKQRASASVVDRDVFSRRLRPRKRRPQHLMLSEDVLEWTVWAPSPWSLRTRKPCGTPLL